MALQLRIGISGWNYKFWRGEFYPKGLVQKRELEFASRQMNSIEINGTFYSLQRPSSYRKWHDETPADFIFAVKGPMYVTHRKRLKDVRQPLANFYASGVLQLGKKLGPVLWQFPPFLTYNRERMSAFLELLPRTSAAASMLAHEHNLKKSDWIAPEAIAKTKIRYAFEPRHESFFCEDFVELLREHNAALVFADAAGKFPYAEDITSDLIYIRLHGSEEIYASGYRPDELDRWASRMKKWRDGLQPSDAIRVSKKSFRPREKRDVYVYFDNDIKVHAPFDAINLAARFGGAGPGGGQRPSRLDQI
ncbi:MAG TPA: DUF72 domain-containing protein [Pyrinomonadaceae bacterium]|nr:DUF72 domain-containing protein [Pyrinomonadaceae bacterium]